jgi:hypothetical protein
MAKVRRKLSPVANAALQTQRSLLVACLPEAWASNWLEAFDYQNTLLIESGEEPLQASEFIKCRLEDLTLGAPELKL